MSRTNEYANSLRMLADFFDENPELEAPTSEEMNVFLYNRVSSLSEYAKAFKNFDKNITDDDIKIIKTFGRITLKVWADRTTVCTKKVIGTKKVIKQIPVQYESKEVEEEIVEWECGSILEAARNQATIEELNQIQRLAACDDEEESLWS